MLFDEFTNTFAYKENGYDSYGGHKVALASDAAFPTSGRWSATGFPTAATNGIEHIVVTTVDATPPNLCGDGVVQVTYPTTYA